jgi:drug/metabolite transporter (DMT)-like permease
MKKNYMFWGTLLVASLSINGLCVRSLSLKDVPYYDSLLSRGVFCLFCVILFSQIKGISLRPKSVKTQVFRAAIAGLALSLFTLSYKWLTASTVFVLSNIDVPLLVILGSWVGVRSSLKIRLLSLFSILFLVIYILSLEPQKGLLLGLSSLGTACLLLCFGYYFIKRSMHEENEAVTILTPALAILFYGLVEHLVWGTQGPSWTLPIFIEALLSGASMFVAYYATMKLYLITDIATAEFPTLISSILIQPLEAVFLKNPMELPYLLSTIAFVFVIYRILILQNRSTELTHG